MEVFSKWLSTIKLIFISEKKNTVTLSIFFLSQYLKSHLRVAIIKKKAFSGDFSN